MLTAGGGNSTTFVRACQAPHWAPCLELAFFCMNMVDSTKHRGSKQLQQREHRLLIRQLPALCSILIWEWSHQCWLGYSKVAQTRRQHQEHYTTEVGSNGRGRESDIAPLFRRFTDD